MYILILPKLTVATRHSRGHVPSFTLFNTQQDCLWAVCFWPNTFFEVEQSITIQAFYCCHHIRQNFKPRLEEFGVFLSSRGISITSLCRVWRLNLKSISMGITPRSVSQQAGCSRCSSTQPLTLKTKTLRLLCQLTGWDVPLCWQRKRDPLLDRGGWVLVPALPPHHITRLCAAPSSYSTTQPPSLRKALSLPPTICLIGYMCVMVSRQGPPQISRHLTGPALIICLTWGGGWMSLINLPKPTQDHYICLRAE